MERFNFTQVHLLLIDQDSLIRQTLRNILTDNGFRNIRVEENLDDLHGAFETLEPDLLIGDMDMQSGTLASFVRRLRHHDLPANPFIPVIATSWEPTPNSVRKIINAGADDLLSKPVSAGRLLDRIKGLIVARKPFVVTHAYIGPERRSRNAPPRNSAPQFSPPNVLRTKALAQGRIDPADIQRQIDDAVSTVNLLKLDRNAVQLLHLMERIVPSLAMFSELDDGAKIMIERLIYLCEDTARRMNKVRGERTGELCEALIRVIVRLREAPNGPTLRDINLLKPLVQSIRVGGTPHHCGMGKSRPDTTRRIEP